METRLGKERSVEVWREPRPLGEDWLCVVAQMLEAKRWTGQALFAATVLRFLITYAYSVRGFDWCTNSPEKNIAAKREIAQMPWYLIGDIPNR